MKKRLLIIVLLSINLLGLIFLQIYTIKQLNSNDDSIPTINKIDSINVDKSNIELDEKQKLNLKESELESTNKDNDEKNADNVITNIKDIKNNDIGVVITNNGNLYHNKVTLKSKGIFTVYYGKNLNKIKTYKGRVVINNKKFFGNNEKVRITCDKKINIQGLSKVDFGGYFYIYKEEDGFVAVNEINIEEYLYGVIGSEMPNSFEIEALKAQAVCARTYAYSHINNKTYKKYNAIMDDTVSYQAYGNSKADEKIRNAVDGTKSQVLNVNGKLISAYYFSTSCGYTTDGNIWNENDNTNNEEKYLVSKFVGKEGDMVDVMTGDYFNSFIRNKSDNYESETPFYRWNVVIKNEDITAKIKEIRKVDIGKIINININSRGAGGIVSNLEIEGDKRKLNITNQNEIRKILNPANSSIKLNDSSERKGMTMLPSAFFTLEKAGEEAYKYIGGGFGHGSGMSQYGANEMAKIGMTYKEILSFFYPGVICDQINTQ